MGQLNIDIFSDPVCPWCLVGLAQLDVALAGLEEDVQISISHHAYLLDAKTPYGGEDVVKMLKKKYGRSPKEMWNRLEQEAKTIGLKLDMRKQKWRHPSQKALVLIAAAKDKGSQHEFARAISHACYMEALNISDREVLLKIALLHGFTEDEVDRLLVDEEALLEVEKNAEQAKEAGISGVPTFIFNGKFALSGAHPTEVFEGAFKKALSLQ